MAAGKRIETKLDTLADLIRASDRENHESLRPPAKPEALSKLEQSMGRALPEDLRAWFQWHDGQDVLRGALDPSRGLGMLSASEVRSAYRFLRDPKEDILEPFDHAWLPLLESPGGDYAVYDLKKRRLLVWRHDDKKRPALAKSLTAYVDDLLEQFENATPRATGAAKQARRAPAPVVPLPPAPKAFTWTVVKSPVPRSALAAHGVATVYDLNPNPKNHQCYVRVGTDAWLYVGGSSFDRVRKFWREVASKPDASRGYTTDKELAANIASKLKRGWEIRRAVT